MSDAHTHRNRLVERPTPGPTRRGFLSALGFGGAGALTSLALAGCHDSPTAPGTQATFALHTASGPLNLLYAYAQFLSDFYQRVTNNPFVGITKLEHDELSTIADHKDAQRTALTTLVTAGRVGDILLFDFSAVDFSSRASVMSHAQTFEDLGVAAVNGLAPSFQNATDLTLAAKIGSSWARHSAVIRDLNDIAAGSVNTSRRTSFAATADATGLDPAMDPAAFVAAAQPYFRTKLAAS